MEYVDVYDKNRVKTGKIRLRENPPEEGEYGLVVNIWIVNDRNEVLLTRRHPKKRLWGGLWECSAAGGVMAGEDSLQGAIREAKEEIGVVLFQSDAVLIDSGIVREKLFRDSYLFKKNIDIGDLTLQSGEVADAKWATEAEFDEMCEKGLIAPPVRSFWQLYNNILSQ